MNDTEKEAAKKAASFISGLLRGWGVPAAWAKAITGAVIGAAIGILIAVGALTSCTALPQQDVINPKFIQRAIELWGNSPGPIPMNQINEYEQDK